MIGSGRDKIETSADLQKAVETAQSLQLDGLVVAGGDDSNTNAAVLAEHFLSQGGDLWQINHHRCLMHSSSSKLCISRCLYCNQHATYQFCKSNYLDTDSPIAYSGTLSRAAFCPIDKDLI